LQPRSPAGIPASAVFHPIRKFFTPDVFLRYNPPASVAGKGASPKRKMNLFIFGPPGCGKTTVGMLVAERMGWHFVDTDKVIENTSGMPITEIFLQKGEPEFRAMEKRMLSELVARTRTVVALGGGTLIDPENRALVESSGPVVCLSCEPEIVLQRMGNELNARPLLAGPGPLERLKALLAKRSALYSSFPLALETSALAPEDAAWKVQRLAGIFRVNAMGAGYDVLIGRKLLPRLAAELEERKLTAPLALVSDTNVAVHYLGRLKKDLSSLGCVSSIVIESGEDTKTVETVEAIYSRLFQEKMERRGTVIAMGGGVVTDIAGFAAATYIRGVAWVALPTSLLGMVDAAIGGKTAVDLPQGKNLVGSFYPPAMVLADLDTLATLPERELRMGLSEAVKAAVVGDSKLLGILEKMEGRLEPAGLDEIVRRAARVKVRVVEEDPFERRGPREALNFGHTIGHAIESVSKYRVPHGEAVALGMVVESALAENIGIAEPGLSSRLTCLLAALRLPTRHKTSAEKVLEQVAADKKRRGGRVKWALPISAGKVRVGLDVADEDIRKALEVLR
jgi:shikimate kinase/3-dehydroquinate synthase